MDLCESTRVVYQRILELEPEFVTKVVGYVLLQDHGEKEMIRLAFSPDHVIHSLINRAKLDLGLTPEPSIPASSSHSTPLFPLAPRSFSSPPIFHLQDYNSPVSFYPHDPWSCPNRVPFMESESICLNLPTNRRSSSMPDFPVKICRYFNKGFCKNGFDCRYLHCTETRGSQNEEHHPVLPNSLKKLEVEIVELLKSNGGDSISMASLPMLFYEKYARTLETEGYPTECRRHCKAGCSLIKILRRLNSSIRLVDRSQGQHSLVLEENGIEGNHAEDTACSKQIYLTFPAESSFSEEDISSYFSKFGSVEDVRIPYQQKRMFGFVTFVNSGTVEHVFAKGNPHFICGSSVLVKPYRKKSRIHERKCIHKCQHCHYLNTDPELHLVEHVPRVGGSTMLVGNQLIERHDQALEFERIRFSSIKLPPGSSTSHPPLYPPVNEPIFLQENTSLSSDDQIHSLPSSSEGPVQKDDEIGKKSNASNDQESQEIDLPESPFSSETVISLALNKRAG